MGHLIYRFYELDTQNIYMLYLIKLFVQRILFNKITYYLFQEFSMVTKTHKIFLSYHYSSASGDLKYKEQFEEMFGDLIISKSVKEGAIDSNLPTETVRQKIRDEYLRDSTVTVVLIGPETWKRKHVDWEIGSSLRNTKYSSRSGLLGIILPTYPLYTKGEYYPYTIPPRLYDNLENKFASLHLWTENPTSIQKWIHAAFERRNTILPNNSRTYFSRNRDGDRWYD